jgi:hypothetical protein
VTTSESVAQSPEELGLLIRDMVVADADTSKDDAFIEEHYARNGMCTCPKVPGMVTAITNLGNCTVCGGKAV